MSASISQSLVIDLGERDRAVEWPRLARRRVPRLRAAIALVAVAILIPTSSQRACAVIAPALWRAPGTYNFVVDKDRVYLINQPGDSAGDGVTALSARTGATLWRLRWQQPVSDVAVLSGGILAVSTHPEIIGEPVTALAQTTVHVVDADGGLLAEFPGVVHAVVPGTDIWLSGERHSISSATTARTRATASISPESEPAPGSRSGDCRLAATLSRSGVGARPPCKTSRLPSWTREVI